MHQQHRRRRSNGKVLQGEGLSRRGSHCRRSQRRWHRRSPTHSLIGGRGRPILRRHRNRSNGTPSKQAYLDANGKAINCALMDAIVPRQEPVSIKAAEKKLGVSEGNVRRAAAVKKDQSRSLRRPQGGQDRDRRDGKEGQGEGSGKGMKKTAASEAQKPPKGHPYVQGFREFQFLDGGRPVLIHKHAVLFAAPLKEEPEIAVLAGAIRCLYGSPMPIFWHGCTAV